MSQAMSEPILASTQSVMQDYLAIRPVIMWIRARGLLHHGCFRDLEIF